MSRKIFSGIFLSLSLLFSVCVVEDTTYYPVNLIPAPVEMEHKAGAFHINEQTTIFVNSEEQDAQGVAELMAEQLRKATGFPILVAQQKSGANCITLQINKLFSENPEAYTLEVTADNVLLQASSAKGLFIGSQTIRQLLPKEVELTNVSEVNWLMPNVSIQDEPRFTWRGMHLDVSRHFFSKEYIKRFLDYMALYKMNTFHWHLTDDQGWRIEIKQYPELTTNGAFRTENRHDRICNEQAEENPDMVITPELFKEVDGQKVYGGYYTQEDIREIISYAQARNITIIPEIDMPGHFKAAIDNYPEVSCFGKAGWGQQFSSPLCVGNEQTYQLVENILSEVIDLFPAPYIHIGADEVEKSNWEKCKKCQARIKSEKLADEHALQSYFVHRIERFINSKGKKMIGWDEILEGGMSKSATMMFWRGWKPDAPQQAATQGNDVIMSPTTHCYFDYKQNGGTLEHVYGFEPVPDGLTTEQASHILGGQGNIWTEYIPSEARADYMSMPRLVALSEVLWTPQANKEWHGFFVRMGAHFDRLDVMGVNYRIPDIGGLYDTHAFLLADTVAFTSQMSNQEIRFTTDGSIPDRESELYTLPIVVTEAITLQARPFNKKGVGGDVLKAQFKKQNYIEAIQSPSVQPGLSCSYYEGQGWKDVSDIGKLDVKKGTYIMSSFDLPEAAQKRRTSFALVYKGYIQVDKDGIYTFSLLCDDAGVLEIASQVVVDNDGMHAPVKKTGQIALTKGLHPINLQYVEGRGGGILKLTTLNADGLFEPVAADHLFH